VRVEDINGENVNEQCGSSNALSLQLAGRCQAAAHIDSCCGRPAVGLWQNYRAKLQVYFPCPTLQKKSNEDLWHVEHQKNMKNDMSDNMLPS
jgi:hypothetical protein